MRSAIFLSLFFMILPLLHADSGSFTNSGGSGSGASTGITITGSTVASPAGTLSISCPESSPANCAGGTLHFASGDGTSSITGSFTSGRFAESCYGGGRGSTTKCYWSLTAYFSGTWTLNGNAQAIVGATYQSFPAAGTTGSVTGTTGFNSAYTPFYFTDGNARILRSDDLSGSNAIAYGTQGSGAGQFYGPSGIALDASGRIYITDTYNDRIVRIDDLNGTNWTSFGTYGSGTGQFDIPQSISIDPAGHIWVLDNGNGRLVRMDDMNGTNWTIVGTAGSGVGQFTALSSAPGFDSLGRIYVADAGTGWIARFDDLSFTNWTTTPVLGAVTGVVVDPAGKIYAADSTPASVIRVDDMTGANRSSISLGTFGAHTIASDSSGMVLLGNGYNAQIDDGQAAVLTSNIDGTILVGGVYASVYGAVPISLPSPRPSAVSFNPPTLSISQNLGGTSPNQPVTVTNFGGSPLSISNISVSGAGFAQTNTCLGTVSAGSTCTINVTFTPSGAGTFNGTLTITDTSGNLGISQTLALTGTATAPAATVSPTSLNFGSQILGTSSAAKTITLTDSGTGPMNVSLISITGPFSQTNNCISLAAGASCAISVTFTPTALGSAAGTVSITDDVGTQTVSLSGRGVGPLTLSPSSLEFNSQIVGTTSAPQTVTATNNGTTSISITSIAISGSGFAISSNTCGSSLGAGANCAVSVTFGPTSAGDAAGALTFTDSAIGSPQSVSIQGNGTGAVSVSPANLSFGTVTVGTTSAAKTITLTNRESVAVSFTSITTSANFKVASNTCGASVAAGASCTAGVTFSPNAVGDVTGTLTFTDSAPTSPQVVTLSGTGGGTPVTLSATSLSFGTMRVGNTSSAKTVTLTNHQNVSLNFTSIAATSPYAISSNTCGSSIGPLGSCTVGVTFTPKVKGTINGTLTFTDDAGNSPQKVSLTGSGK